MEVRDEGECCRLLGIIYQDRVLSCHRIDGTVAQAKY